jgi:hypothetical protein
MQERTVMMGNYLGLELQPLRQTVQGICLKVQE